ncbi:anthranilate synthase component II [Roseivirga misakiensis]|uniref:Aminodeoxychorismate/anthranilate synthase component II n=1 Tax=Roseivirga misakiensis TaxID=1563681 RepID=A0A1E5T608_9BACT|nr:aminodeoxychorismate/anthranilate synthase component II [Roseivirga misakiensis]OEK06824.1 aminodeoxychorismate/anthranilate synthase component II [Roseivirga misakiensis]
MILLIDNYDSFTYNLVDYFNQLGIEVKVMRNNVSLDQLNPDDFSGIVLSPGPEKPSDAGNLLPIIAQFLGRLPMIGICLGHQAIAQHLGAKLEKAKRPMHGKISQIEASDSHMYDGLPLTFNVVRYHSLIVAELPKILTPTAKTSTGELMSFEGSEDLKVWGIQFHPEAFLTEYGLEILKNWVRFNEIV